MAAAAYQKQRSRQSFPVRQRFQAAEWILATPRDLVALTRLTACIFNKREQEPLELSSGRLLRAGAALIDGFKIGLRAS